MVKSAGQQLYEDYWARQFADPEFARVAREESEKKDLWIALVDARQAAGLTQAQVASRLGVSEAQVARIERRGYESHSLATLRRYVHALGEGFEVEVHIRFPAKSGATTSA